MPGSTPPVRGIYLTAYMHTKGARFNPARAGNILFHHRRILLQQVQPRPCGEYYQNLDLF